MLNMDIGRINCGCESRKEVMFIAGKPGVLEAVILGTATIALLAAIIYAKGSH